MDWGAARILRLFPGLIVALALTVLVLGPVVTNLPLAAYFTDPATLVYLPQNLALVTQRYGLPGVFTDNPFPVAINGSLWTLFYEVICYLGVLVLGLAGVLTSRRRMCAVLLLYAGVQMAIWYAGSATPYKVEKLAELSLPFAVGTGLYVWRDSILLNPLIGIALAGLAVLLHNTQFYHISFVVALAYGVFIFAYLPRGFIRKYNRLGDYSYGIYIYAFPLQQLSVHLFGPQTAFQNMMSAGAIFFSLAALSWHFVEKSSLSSRAQLVHLICRGCGERRAE